MNHTLYQQHTLDGAYAFGNYLIEKLEKKDAGRQRSSTKTAVSEIKQAVNHLDMEAIRQGYQAIPNDQGSGLIRGILTGLSFGVIIGMAMAGIAWG